MDWPCMATEKCLQHMPLLAEAIARGLALTPMTVFEIRIYKSQSDNQDPHIGDPR